MLPKCAGTPVVIFILQIHDRHLEFTGSGVNTASGMMDYDGLAERDITFILFASQ